MKILTLLLLISTNLIAICYDVNNYDTNPKLYNMPIKNQADMSTCYAHSLATIYNVDQAKEGASLMDPYWIALTHKDKIFHWKPKNLNYSLLSMAWGDMVKKKVCDYDLVQTKISELKNGVEYSDDQFFYMIKTFFKVKKWNNLKKNKKYNKILNKTLSILVKDSRGFELDWTIEDLRKIIDPIRLQIGSKWLFKYFNKNVFASCKSNLDHPTGLLISSARKKQMNEQVQNRLNEQLLKGRSIAVGYCSKVIKQDPRTSKDITTKKRLYKAFKKNCGAHYAVIVGSRTFGNKCDLLVRNSYGTDFWTHKSRTCLCENSKTKEKFNCSKAESQGHKVLGCWISSEKLLNNTFDISYFN